MVFGHSWSHREVKTSRGFFILKKVFYEKMMCYRASQYCDDVKSWTLPFLEILYIGNFLYVIRDKPKYINPLLRKVNEHMKKLPKNHPEFWDKYSYLLFFKAFLLKLGGNTEDAMTYFHEILSLESIIEKEVQVIPQTCYEIGLVHRANGKTVEAKRWFNKTLKYSEYQTEFLVQWRCKYALERPKPMEYTLPAPESITQILPELDINNNNIDEPLLTDY